MCSVQQILRIMDCVSKKRDYWCRSFLHIYGICHRLHIDSIAIQFSVREEAHRWKVRVVLFLRLQCNRSLPRAACDIWLCVVSHGLSVSPSVNWERNLRETQSSVSGLAGKHDRSPSVGQGSHFLFPLCAGSPVGLASRDADHSIWLSFCLKALTNRINVPQGAARLWEEKMRGRRGACTCGELRSVSGWDRPAVKITHTHKVLKQFVSHYFQKYICVNKSNVWLVF